MPADIADLLKRAEKLDGHVETADDVASHIGSTLGESFSSSAGARALLINRSPYNA